MKNFTFHNATQFFLLVVMTMTSTGFSTVVGYCSMSKSSICCCDMEQTCEETSSSEALSIKNVKPSCYSEKVAGGVNDVKAIFNGETVQKQFSTAIAAEAPEHRITDITSQESRFPKSPHSALSPAGVDIYIHVSSFLI